MAKGIQGLLFRKGCISLRKLNDSTNDISCQHTSADHWAGDTVLTVLI